MTDIRQHPAMARIRERLGRLYGEGIDRCVERMAMMIGRYGLTGTGSAATRWNERSAVLITYGDTLQRPGEKPLATLKRFADAHLAQAFSHVHILPFFPYTSDDGFSVVHYRNVNPALGDWSHVRALNEQFGLMFDLVLNHVSSRSGWFQDYVAGVAPGRDYFIALDPKTDLSAVVRPRSSPLLTPVMTRGGARHVWTTFSADQVDLNFANPDVLFEILDILLFYVSMGARIVRLDAIAYLWKKVGTSCIHLPETHEVVKLLRDVTDIVAPGVILLTETNVPQADNISYAGSGDEAHMIYQFPLPPLVLHALHRGDARHLTAWATALPALPQGCTWLNFTSSHDGIGVRPLRGLVPDGAVDELAAHVRTRGGQVSLARKSDGTEEPYELNITYFDAMGKNGEPEDLHVRRFLCSQMIPLALAGVPAVYIHSLTASRNDLAGLKETGRARSINRGRWMEGELEKAIGGESAATSRVFAEYTRVLALRAAHPVFHPDAAQRILDLGPALFAVERRTKDGAAVLAVSNCTAEAQEATVPGSYALNLLTGRPAGSSGGKLRLEPYETAWLQ